MSDQERITDLMSIGMFNENELVSHDQPNSLSSIEYWQIMHYTNEELYYLDEETHTDIKECADIIEETSKGIAFLFE